MIEHTVTFCLKHKSGSVEEQEFFEAAGKLASIGGVRDFTIRRQTNEKNTHTFGISMMFENAESLQAYCDHPLHTSFIEERWLKEVSDFQEADFESL